MNTTRFLAGAAALGVTALLLTGCSSSKDYTSPSQIQRAYEDAGGKCKKHFDLPQSLVGEGVHAVTCSPSIDTMVVFDTDEDQRRYLASTVEGDTQAVVGDKWAMITQDADKWADALGGEAQKG